MSETPQSGGDKGHAWNLLERLRTIRASMENSTDEIGKTVSRFSGGLGEEEEGAPKQETPHNYLAQLDLELDELNRVLGKMESIQQHLQRTI